MNQWFSAAVASLVLLVPNAGAAEGPSTAPTRPQPAVPASPEAANFRRKKRFFPFALITS